MTDTNIGDPDDAVIEIKGPFDREVARRFDTDRIAADHARRIRHAEARMHLGHGVPAAPGASTGPFARVPVPLQWLGLAAALIAAAAGIFTLYRDGRAPRAASVVVGSTAPGVPPQGPSASEDAEPSAASPPAAPIAPHGGNRRHEREPSSEPPSRDQDQPGATGSDGSSPSGPPTVASVAPDRKRDAPAPSSGGGAVASTTITGQSTARATTTAPSPASKGAAVIATGALPAGAGVVRVASQRLFQQGLYAKVFASPALKATIIMVDGIGRLRGPGGAPPPPPDPRALAQQDRDDAAGGPNSPPSGSDPARPDGARDERPATAPDETGLQPPGRDRRSSLEPPIRGAYYVRAFIGSALEELAPENQGYLGKDTDAIALRAHEAWGDPLHQTALRGTFALRSLVAIDGVLVPIGYTGAGAGELSVAAGGKVYAIKFKGTRVDGNSAEYNLLLTLARKFPRATRGASAPGLEIPVVVPNGAVAVVCLPDPLFADRGWTGTGPQSVLCVAVSPRFADLAPKRELPETPGGGWDDTAEVVERIEPAYPEEARAVGFQGKVHLQATVLRDGSVDGVHVVAIDDLRPLTAHFKEPFDKDFLIEPASSAVRRWRFLPARSRGESFDSVVNVTIEFRLDPDPEK